MMSTPKIAEIGYTRFTPPQPTAHSSLGWRALFATSAFLSAGLMFWLEPMIARMLMPAFGGSPAVWNTSIVFYQILLVAGYAYAHGSVRLLGDRRQRAMQCAVVLVSLLALPRAIGALQQTSKYPVLSLLGVLFLTAGATSFVLASNSSIIQHWFSAKSGDDRSPAWLYAASNLGSLLVLLGYPFAIEPAFGLREQLEIWRALYAAFAIVTVVTAAITYRRLPPGDDRDADPERGGAAIMSSAPPDAISLRRQCNWLIWSAVAASLLLSVTMQISTDVVSAPLFWVIPLALYLLSFVVAFAYPEKCRALRPVIARVVTYGVAICFVVLVIPTLFPLWLSLAALLSTLFAGALICHGDLAADRPAARNLTQYYLWIAVGGAVGGVLNSLIAPVVFRSVAEYPITLACVAVLASSKHWWATLRRVASRRTVASWPGAAMIVATVLAAVMVLLTRHPGLAPASDTSALRWQFMSIPVLICGVLFVATPGLFALSALLTSAFVVLGLNFVDPVIDQRRSFFGVSRVTENAYERVLIHGVTVHGEQRRSAALRDVPTSYYSPNGPLGWAVAHAPDHAHIGIVGLGAGSLATLARAGQRLTYYEIDPVVEQMARDDFTFLADTRATLNVVTGDGRQTLAQAPDGEFDLLLIDAFNSDAIPTHLLTAEALQLYLGKLRPNGVLVLHISNRYADLTRVLRGWEIHQHEAVAISQYVPSAEAQAAGDRPTLAVAIGRTPNALKALAVSKAWYWLDTDGPQVYWTDDHVNLIAVLDRNVLRP